MSLIYGQKWPGSLFGSVGISGLANLEITPEFALKLGQAFGTSLKAGQTVMTSRDTHPASRVMNRCIISGLLSVGVNVLDLRSYPLPLARYAVRVGSDGGVHVRVAPDDANAVVFEFFDAHRDRDRQRRRTQDRKPLLPRRLPPHADGRSRPARLPLARARTLLRRVRRGAARRGAARKRTSAS